MRVVQWKDGNGRNHKAMIRDGDPVSYALDGYGISMDPPNVDNIDWDALKTEIHNAMLEHGLVSYESLRRSGNGFNVVLNIVKRHIVNIFKKQQGG